MGTRAAFWVGDPRELDKREWLGCIAYDGYPSDELAAIIKAPNKQKFRESVAVLASKREDFAKPEDGWPFPWADDIFLTDYTYAFFGGSTQVSHYRYGFGASISVNDDPSCVDVPAPAPYDPSQPDSIMVMVTKR